MSVNSITIAAPAKHARAGGATGSSVADAVHAILSLPDEALDYAPAKLAFDRIIDPSIDGEATLSELDRMAENARQLAGPCASESDALRALRTLIYESGPWNDHRPFAYDHADPLGRNIRNKLLPTYLATRLGNCVSMPALFLILGEKLGLDIALASAPSHVFLRHREASGRIVNLEATSGALPARDVWYRQNFPMRERALESGLYMRSLSRREGIALFGTTLIEHLVREKRYKDVIAAGEILVQHHPRESITMVNLGSSYGRLAEIEFEAKYPFPLLIPLALRARYLMLIERNQSLIGAAEALGWEPDK